MSGILGWIQNIFKKIGDTFDKIVEIFAEIKELPSKIWVYIENGLKALFIPAEEDIESFSSKMDKLMENKLGAVYQIGGLLSESWEIMISYEVTETIEFPTVSIPLPGGNEFTFGGYDVKIVPEGFEWILETIQIATGVLCGVAFVNGLRKRYDEIFGG